MMTERVYKNEYELTARYDSRKSFYGKARVLEGTDGTIYLKSYDTIVATCKGGTVELIDRYSTTTDRHQHEFYLQNDTTGRTWEQVKSDSGTKGKSVKYNGQDIPRRPERPEREGYNYNGFYAPPFTSTLF